MSDDPPVTSLLTCATTGASSPCRRCRPPMWQGVPYARGPLAAARPGYRPRDGGGHGGPGSGWPSQSWQQVFRDGVLDHRVKELARVFIAKTLECGYCAAQRSDLGAAQGLTERAFDEVIDFRRSQLLTARDNAALRWAEAIAWDPGLADDGLWAELHRHFTEPELVELGYFIGLTMGQQRFLKTLGVRHGDLGRDSLAGLAPDAAAALTASRDAGGAPSGRKKSSRTTPPRRTGRTRRRKPRNAAGAFPGSRPVSGRTYLYPRRLSG